MTRRPYITVAPTGGRLQKTDHPALPVSVEEIALTARACHAAGADEIHLHVRDPAGAHSLDAGLYRDAIAATEEHAPGLAIQITTESIGRYSVADQHACLEALRPHRASLAIREAARDMRRAASLYALADEQGTEIQHILYGPDCIAQLSRWIDDGTIPGGRQPRAIFVLGAYAPRRNAVPADLNPVFRAARDLDLRWSVCAFGPAEQDCLLEAARHGGDVRIGFENNLHAPGGVRLWRDNAEAVTCLCEKLAAQADTHA